MTAPSKIRVLLVDDHPVVRMGMRGLIDGQPDMTVVAEAANGREAIAAHRAHRPDITLMDIRMPELDGPEAIAAIRAQEPGAAIIVLTTYDGDADVYRAVQAGARGYLLKGTFAEGMLEAIRLVHAGGSLVAPELEAKLAAGGPPLSAREVEVLQLVAKGLSNKEIGAALFVSEETVKQHLKHVYAKLDVDDRTAAALVAVQRGILRM